MYDVIIIGGGPGGSTAGQILSTQGLKCLLLDYKKFPRDKPCGGALTTRVIERFPYVKQLIDVSNYTATVHYNQNEYNIAHTAEIPNFYFVRRIKFDNDLLNLAKNSNCEVIEGVKISDVIEESNLVRVITTDKKVYESHFLIGADGINSIVRQKTGLNKFWSKKNLALIVTNEIEIKEQIIEQYYSNKYETHIHFIVGKAMGYGWIFPKRKCVNYGYGELLKNNSQKEIRQHLDDYLNYCVSANLLPKEGIQFSVKSWLLQSGGPMKQFTTDRVFLVGDAAGFTNPISGEGIIYAMWSAQIISEYIIKYKRGTVPFGQIRGKYQNECNIQFGKELKELSSYMMKMKPFMKYIFRLATHDKEFLELIPFLAGAQTSMTYQECKKKMFKRVLIGALKGTIWKK